MSDNSWGPNDEGMGPVIVLVVIGTILAYLFMR